MKQLLAFLRQPVRYLIHIWRCISGRGIKYKIYMKSGNIIVLDLNRLSWKYSGGDIKELNWDASLGPHHLKHIDVSEIEAITIIL